MSHSQPTECAVNAALFRASQLENGYSYVCRCAIVEAVTLLLLRKLVEKRPRRLGHTFSKLYHGECFFCVSPLFVGFGL